MTDSAPSCPGCSNTDLTRIGRLPDSEWFAGKRLAQPLVGGYLYLCRQCLLKFRYPIQPSATYNALYDNAQTGTWQATVARPDWDLLIKLIGACAPNGGRILDFGCYSGGLLSMLDDRYERYGVEVNRKAACIAGEKAHAQVWNSAQDIPANLQFEVIVLADVVEHVSDPCALLNVLAQRLTANGVILVTTGDADAPMWNFFGANWWYCFYPEHIAFVSLAWAQRTLCTHGWSVSEYQRFRNGQLNISQRFSTLVFVCAYGIAPRAYLKVCRFLKRKLGHGEDVTSVPGRGITRDHILLTLQRK